MRERERESKFIIKSSKNRFILVTDFVKQYI